MGPGPSSRSLHIRLVETWETNLETSPTHDSTPRGSRSTPTRSLLADTTDARPPCSACTPVIPSDRGGELGSSPPGPGPRCSAWRPSASSRLRGLDAEDAFTTEYLLVSELVTNLAGFGPVGLRLIREGSLAA